MVTYQTMIRLAFEVADSKGASFDGIDDSGRFISELAEYWQSNKSQLKQLTEQQTKRQLDRVVEP